MRRLLVLTALAFGVFTLTASASTSGTLTVDQTDLHHGDTATFTATFNGSETQLFEWGVCTQDGVAVYGWSLVSPSDAATIGVVMGSDYWTSGGAHCHAELAKHRDRTYTVLATTDFDVGP